MIWPQPPEAEIFFGSENGEHFTPVSRVTVGSGDFSW